MAATAYINGLNGMGLLRTEDPVALLVMQAVASRADELHRERADQQAVRIANRVGDLFKDG